MLAPLAPLRRFAFILEEPRVLLHLSLTTALPR